MNLQLKPEAVAALHLRTEGWIVGLRLPALSLRGHSSLDREGLMEQFIGSHQFVLAELTEEVLRALSDVHSVVPMSVTIVVAAAMLSMGTYGIVRFPCSAFTLEQVAPFGLPIVVGEPVSSIYGALCRSPSRT